MYRVRIYQPVLVSSRALRTSRASKTSSTHWTATTTSSENPTSSPWTTTSEPTTSSTPKSKALKTQTSSYWWESTPEPKPQCSTPESWKLFPKRDLKSTPLEHPATWPMSMSILETLPKLLLNSWMVLMNFVKLSNLPNSPCLLLVETHWLEEMVKAFLLKPKPWLTS